MRIRIFPLTFFLVATCLICAYGQPKEYGYVFLESTGQNQFALIGRTRVPIIFDQTASDQVALLALMSMKPSILYGNGNGRRIILSGEFQAQTHVFTLRHWYIRTPFVEWAVKDESHIPHQIRKRMRNTLTREDFQKSETFDPFDNRFDPLSFTRRSKARVRS